LTLSRKRTFWKIGNAESYSYYSGRSIAARLRKGTLKKKVTALDRVLLEGGGKSQGESARRRGTRVQELLQGKVSGSSHLAERGKRAA